MNEVRFIHLTDLHIGHPTEPDSHLYSDTSETLQKTLQIIKEIEPKPAFIVASGDLTNRGDPASFRHLKSMFADIDIPVFYALGNHDTREGYYKGMLDRETEIHTPLFYDQLIEGIHVIVLDSSIPGKISGALDEHQFTWLAERLQAYDQSPKLIVSHHPPALGDIPDWDFWRTIEFHQSQRLADLLKGKNILGILSGHIHHDRVSMWHGVPVIVGTGHHAATDILHTEGLRMVSAASFGLGVIRSSGLTIAFVPMPSERKELNYVPYDRMIKMVTDLENSNSNTTVGES